MTFREDKATAVAALFIKNAGGELEYLKLLKLMYLAERESLRAMSTSITGDTFYSMKRGPVMSATYDLIKDDEAWLDFDHENWTRTIEPPAGFKVRLKAEFDAPSVLSDFEMQLVDHIWDDFKDVDQWDLVDWMHETFPEWKNTTSRTPIELGDIFRALGFDESETGARILLQRELARLERLLSEARDVA